MRHLINWGTNLTYCGEEPNFMTKHTVEYYALEEVDCLDCLLKAREHAQQMIEKAEQLHEQIEDRAWKLGWNPQREMDLMLQGKAKNEDEARRMVLEENNK